MRKEMIHKLHDQGEFLLKYMGYGYYWVTSCLIRNISSIHVPAVPTAITLPPACLDKDDNLPGDLPLPVVLREPKLRFIYTKQA